MVTDSAGLICFSCTFDYFVYSELAHYEPHMDRCALAALNDLQASKHHKHHKTVQSRRALWYENVLNMCHNAS